MRRERRQIQLRELLERRPRIESDYLLAQHEYRRAINEGIEMERFERRLAETRAEYNELRQARKDGAELGITGPPGAYNIAAVAADQLEFRVGTVVGYRHWRVSETGLVAVNAHALDSDTWPAKHRHEAVCRYGRDHQDQNGSQIVPYPTCTCGIYAWKEPLSDIPPRPLRPAFAELPPILTGEVHLWGRIEQHTLGYRGQYAYPKSFYWGPFVEKMAELYGVPIVDNPYQPGPDD
jgi:hypothetical protein